MRRQVAIYARVSSDQQADAGTIASQIEVVKERVVGDGFELEESSLFTDNGYSGATLVRPALERLRDVIAAGGIDRLYVHSPDRLARKYAYQILLVDEFRRAGVEVADVDGIERTAVTRVEVRGSAHERYGASVGGDH
jgi:site-specific DNA recombinase